MRIGKVCFAAGYIKYTGVNDVFITGLPNPLAFTTFFVRSDNTGTKIGISLNPQGGGTPALSFYLSSGTPTTDNTYSFNIAYITA